MAVKKATLAGKGGTPKVEIIFGFAHSAKFEFFLYDAQRRNPVKFAEGVNSDDIPDIFDIGNPGPVTALNGCTLFWQAAIASATSAPGQQYMVHVRVMQDGKLAGADDNTGPLSNPPPFGFIRLEVV